MNDGQTLLERCLLLPADATARKVFADWLQEHGDGELAEEIRGDRGEEHLRELQYESNRIARFPCVKFLWAVVFVLQAGRSHIQAAAAAGLDFGPGSLLTLPEGWQTGPMNPPQPSAWPVPFSAPRRGWFRRLFGG